MRRKTEQMVEPEGNFLCFDGNVMDKYVIFFAQLVVIIGKLHTQVHTHTDVQKQHHQPFVI